MTIDEASTLRNERRRRKFVELAEKRVNRALDDFRLIGNLSNRHNYDYTEEDVRKIIGALESELRLLKKRFSTESEDSRRRFELQ
jgi:hypothetical protein